MHNKALECAKSTLEEFCAIKEPTCEQSAMFESVMCGLKAFIESEYKAKIIDEMKEAKEEEKAYSRLDVAQRMGYRNRDAMGRYISKRRGYRPYLESMDDEDYYMNQYLDNPNDFKHNMRFGYDDGMGNRTGNNMQMPNNGNMNNSRNGYDRSKYGKSYDEYRNHRRYYTETNDPEHQKMMKSKMNEVFEDMEDMASDIINDMTPEEKAKYKQKLHVLSEKF